MVKRVTTTLGLLALVCVIQTGCSSKQHRFELQTLGKHSVTPKPQRKSSLPIGVRINELKDQLGKLSDLGSRVHLVPLGDNSTMVVAQLDNESAPVIWIHGARGIDEGTAFSLGQRYVSTMFIERTKWHTRHRLSGSLLRLPANSSSGCSIVKSLSRNHMGFSPREFWAPNAHVYKCLANRGPRERAWNTHRDELKLRPSSSVGLGHWIVQPKRLPLDHSDFQLLAKHRTNYGKCLMISQEVTDGDTNDANCNLRLVLSSDTVLLQWKGTTIHEVERSDTVAVLEFDISEKKPIAIQQTLL